MENAMFFNISDTDGQDNKHSLQRSFEFVKVRFNNGYICYYSTKQIGSNCCVKTDYLRYVLATYCTVHYTTSCGSVSLILHPLHVKYIKRWTCLSLRLSVRTFELDSWTDYPKMWYGCNGIANHFIQSAITKRWMRKLLRWKRSLIYGPEMKGGNKCWKCNDCDVRL